MNKIDMYKLLHSGVLGNTFRTWSSLFEATLDGYDGPYGMRTLKKGDKIYRGDMTLLEAIKAEREAKHLGVSICEYVPNHLITINAEVTRTPRGLFLKYHEGPGYMKDAMQKPSYLESMKATQMIVKHGGIDLLDQIQYLLDTYDGPIITYGSAIVEFAVFNKPVGMFQKNYIIWECRSY